MKKHSVILASASPRRKLLLETIGLKPIIVAADIDETPYEDENPYDYVKRLAVEKAEVVKDTYDDGLIIAGDTIVILEDQILQKPVDKEEAISMLESLSGREHSVLTGMAIIDNKSGNIYNNVTETFVTMKAYDLPTIMSYVSTKEPLDKAGSYGIQGIGAILVDRIVGDYNTVVGLSITDLINGFDQLNIDFF